MQRQRFPLRRLARWALVALTAGALLVGIPGWSPGGPNSQAGDRAVNAAAASVEPVADPVLVGAGDIASCYLESDQATAALLDGIDGTVFTVGDNAYLDGTAEEFAGCYEPTWGRHRTRTRPAAGNHEYHTPDATPYWDYFGDAAGDRGKGWYSYDLGGWHVVVLNSVLPLEAGSEQERWLRADLAAHQTTCTVAYWHHPRFSSGYHGNAEKAAAAWHALYTAGADLVLNGHEHNYERFHPQDPNGQPDPTGIRQMIVGTGGIALRSIDRVAPNSAVRNDTAWGVMKLTLHPASYDWEFVPVAGQSFTDRGTADCHEGGRPPPAVHASDSFGRSVVDGWGSAEVGGSYTLSGSRSNFDVTGTQATITLPTPGAGRRAHLAGVSERDADVTAALATDRKAVGGIQIMTLIARRTSAGDEYHGRLRLRPDGTVMLGAARVVAGRERVIGTDVGVPGLTVEPGSRMHLRVRVEGAAPAVIRLRAWPDGQPEPDTWQFQTTDTTATLEGPGAVGVRGYLSSSATNAPVTITVDDLRAVRVTDGNTPPQASFTSTCDGLECTLDASTSTDLEGSPSTYAWDFGDGRTGSGEQTTVTYGLPGTYRIVLTVVDAGGMQAAQAQEVTVSVAADPVVADSFGRSVVDGWGSAEVGGSYTLSGSRSNFDVTGTQATITLPTPGAGRRAHLAGVSERDADVTAALATDRKAVGGIQIMTLIARRTSAGDEYHGRLRLRPDGTVMLGAARVVAGRERVIGTDVGVPGLTVEPGSRMHLRVRVEGAAPAVIRLRAWPDGQPEPDTWQFQTTDTTATLEGPGAVGVRGYLSSSATNAPVTITADDLRAVRVGE